MNLFTARIDQFTATVRIAEQLFLVRLCFALLMFLMALFDMSAGHDFDFPSACYILIICAILGLDYKPLLNLVRK